VAGDAEIDPFMPYYGDHERQGLGVLVEVDCVGNDVRRAWNGDLAPTVGFEDLAAILADERRVLEGGGCQQLCQCFLTRNLDLLER